jgi:hypothetical protein
MLLVSASIACLPRADAAMPEDGSSAGTVNEGALRRLRARNAHPPGCAAPGSEDAAARWCEIATDGGVMIRNRARLREVVRAAEKKLARERASSPDASASSDANDVDAVAAGRAVVDAVDAAVEKFDASELARVKKEKAKEKREATKRALIAAGFGRAKPAPAAKEAKAFKCRKRLRSSGDIQYVCAVTDSARKRPAASKDAAASAPSAGASSSPPSKKTKEDPLAGIEPSARCDEFRAWLAAYDKDGGSGGGSGGSGGEESRPRFWRVLARRHDGFATLAKLAAHAVRDGGTGVGRVREAIEGRASRAYKALSREIHPDKLGAFFRDDATPCGGKGGGGAARERMREMLRAAFDRAADLKTCVLKPLRCELNEGELLRMLGEGSRDEL